MLDEILLFITYRARALRDVTPSSFLEHPVPHSYDSTAQHRQINNFLPQ